MVWDVSVIVSSGQSEISLHQRATAVGFNFRKSSSQKISLKTKRGTPKEEDCSQRMHLGVKDELSGEQIILTWFSEEHRTHPFLNNSLKADLTKGICWQLPFVKESQ